MDRAGQRDAAPAEAAPRSDRRGAVSPDRDNSSLASSPEGRGGGSGGGSRGGGGGSVGGGSGGDGGSGVGDEGKLSPDIEALERFIDSCVLQYRVEGTLRDDEQPDSDSSPVASQGSSDRSDNRAWKGQRGGRGRRQQRWINSPVQRGSPSPRPRGGRAGPQPKPRVQDPSYDVWAANTNPYDSECQKVGDAEAAIKDDSKDGSSQVVDGDSATRAVNSGQGRRRERSSRRLYCPPGVRATQHHGHHHQHQPNHHYQQQQQQPDQQQQPQQQQQHYSPDSLALSRRGGGRRDSWGSQHQGRGGGGGGGAGGGARNYSHAPAGSPRRRHGKRGTDSGKGGDGTGGRAAPAPTSNGQLGGAGEGAHGSRERGAGCEWTGGNGANDKREEESEEEGKRPGPEGEQSVPRGGGGGGGGGFPATQGPSSRDVVAGSRHEQRPRMVFSPNPDAPLSNSVDMLSQLLLDMKSGGGAAADDGRLERVVGEAWRHAEADEAALSGVVRTLFEGAVANRSVAAVIARLCSRMLALAPHGNKFRGLLLNALQSEYGRRADTRRRDVERWLGFVTFLCEVYGTMRSSASEPYRVLAIPVYTCLQELLKAEEFKEDAVLCCCLELQSVGRLLEEQLPGVMTETLALVRDKILSPSESALSRSLLLEVVELHATRWSRLAPHASRYYTRTLQQQLTT
ncbi:CBP80/20-dependent translation initiation factor isoform X2 [Petromyzon marinus]|uniref:CBP80/20-dependent translation initiation factor isoform X2 n=1 Tax=Petromyzon marinus TaxID=7757 RepID=UPI003F7006D1